ncbi:CPBP family intramembrane metalloprotease [Ruminococcus sp.]|uniref:CPBP family intramembrane glutamic endopeptidase n=1 Tax=Ruminococcus sp. TaxID=41978 RepID=UPI0025CB9FFB|nr:CPBP family intramembrane metalloprotease [Ruminococcus sp.]MCR4639896.1 CPBP family intramembrane metalloprotease [Ruminococcus sp.]
MLNYRPKMFDEASKSHASKNIFIIILIFIAVFIVIAILESIIPGVVSIKPVLEELADSDLEDTSVLFDTKAVTDLAARVASKPEVMIPTMFSTIFGTICSLIYCRCIEVRKVSSMGVKKAGFFRNYLPGILIGLVLMTAAVLLGALFGIHTVKLSDDFNIGLIVLYFFGFIVQGMSEEFIFRGYFMTTIGGSGKHTLVAVGISSVAFSLAHFGNPGFGPLAFFNIALFGAFAALYMILFDNIWGVCAIHSIWNFMQGNFYGISVSGTGDTTSVFRTVAKSSSTVLTGGKFGIEGSILTTIVLLIATAAVVYGISKKSAAQTAEAQTETVNA